MKNITVFLGSRLPEDAIYRNGAHDLGLAIAQSNNVLVYGGAKVGTMGVLADAALQEGGTVIGVMPTVLSNKEILHPGISETVLVADMQERKKYLMEVGDVFVALPGGCGTMDEIFEVITSDQIGVLPKPYAFINLNGFYDGIHDYLINANKVGYINDGEFSRIHFYDTVEAFIKSGLL